MKCSACTHWSESKEMRPLGHCASEKFVRGYSRAAGAVPRDGILIENDEGWGCLTGPDFGCVHFAGKETT